MDRNYGISSPKLSCKPFQWLSSQSSVSAQILQEDIGL